MTQGAFYVTLPLLWMYLPHVLEITPTSAKGQYYSITSFMARHISKNICKWPHQRSQQVQGKGEAKDGGVVECKKTKE
jgi:hypothetical protein